MNADNSRKSVLVHEPGGGRPVQLGPGGTVRLKIEGLHSNGQMVMYEFTMPPRTAGPPTHIHALWDEAFYVLDGEVTFLIEEEEHLVPTGGCVFVAGQVPHTFWNASDAPATNLTILTPSGLENYFDDVSEALRTGVGEDQVHELFGKYGMEIVDDGRAAYGALGS